jgi:transposase InsO family protein
MTRQRVVLEVGERVLLPDGLGAVTQIARDGYSIAHASGQVRDVAWSELTPFAPLHPDGERAVHRQLSPWWEMLDEPTRQDARMRLGVVLEITTGFREGVPELARDGEPFSPFGPTFGASIQERLERMADQLTRERENDRCIEQRVASGELKDAAVSASTIKNWLRAYQQRGLFGLVDGRRMRRSLGFEVLDPDFRAAILEIVETFDGDRSAVNNKEILRRARVAMKKAGKVSYPQSARAAGEFVSWLFKERGHTTRAQRSNAIRGTSGKTHFPAIRPGQVIAIDATRADVLVWDPLHERAMSVEILTALDVATRCVLACRVVPKSADAVDAGLLLYDVMRPFHMVVEGTQVSDWRWAGIPETVDLGGLAEAERGPLAPAGTLHGCHTIPAVYPEGIRCDHGSIFVSAHFRALCDDLGIDLLLSRGRRPSDNAHGERIHLTYDAFWQQLPGYKSNNVAGRGRKVEQEPLYTAAELEVLLRRWIALDYHQRWHEGITVPGAPEARLSPIEYFDILLDASGRLDLPVHGPYAFLPIRWGTIGHAGVEFNNMAYDSTRLDDFRNVRIGRYRAEDRAMPFFYDPHDVSRVWWMDPDTEVIHEIPWRGRDRLEAPMTDAVLAAVRKRIARRGGNLALSKRSTEDLILRELTQIMIEPPTPESRAMLSAAARRVELSERDHGEVAERASIVDGSDGVVTPFRRGARHTGQPLDVDVDEVWPDYTEGGE